MDGLSRGEWMEKQAQTIWDGMTSVQRLQLLPLKEEQAKASLATLDV